MFHAKSSLGNDVRLSWENFLCEFSATQVLLVRGNHDVRVGPLPKDWPIQIVDPGMIIERVALGHHPSEMPSGADVYLCGHIHPAIQVSSRTERLGRLPCFWLSRGQLVLPAIGEFTGTHLVTLAEGDSAWIAADNEICCYR
jgi:metallophosphoesterase superfamily enzyme